jgi:hypothetical protein
MGVKEVILQMSLQQKVVVVFIAVMIPIGGWLALGAVTTHVALAALGASEVTAIVASVEAIFGVVPPQSTKS